MTTLTNFCDSLEATLDNNTNCHLLPTFSDNKDFQELFNYQDCHFGKKTSQEKINKNDYDLLAKLFAEWKSTQNNNNININKKMVNTNTRNILLIGRTGSGKSTLANVLMGEDKFIESAKSISVTKNIEEGVVEIDLKEDGSEKIRYRVIDTIGLADTKLTPQGVLTKLAEMAGRVKKEGLNQILFVNKGRFTKEEVEAYDLLSSIIFDKEVLKYTTVVRVGFPEFEDQEVCDEDRWELREENPKLAHILNSVKVIYLDNPPLKGRNIETNKEIREESRKRLLTHLATCLEDNYRPSNIDTLDERVQEYRTNEQLLKDKMKELEKVRKEEAEKFRKDMVELKEQQTKELKEMREQAAKDLHDLEVKSDEKLRKTKDELEEKRKKDMDEQDRKNKEQLRQSEERGKQDIKKLEDAQKQQEKAHQEDLRRQREESDKLREDLNKKNDNSELITMMQQARIDEQAKEEKRDRERTAFEQKERQEKREFENKRLNAEESHRQEEANREERRQQREDEKEERRQAKEEASQEQLRKKDEENRRLEAKVQAEKNKWFFERW